jgi:hypothetical protein
MIVSSTNGDSAFQFEKLSFLLNLELSFRYWSHVVNCRSCNAAHKGLNALEVVLQVASLAFVGIVAATKQNVMSLAARNTMIAMAVVCFAGSKLLAHFIYKNFHYQDYNHAFR